MNYLKLRVIGALILGLGLFSLKPAWSQSNSMPAPSLSWGWVTLNLSKADCLQRANLAISVEMKGSKKQVKNDYVWALSDRSNVFIQCTVLGTNKTYSMIVVSSYYGPDAGRLRDVLYIDMQKGVIEGRLPIIEKIASE